MHVTAEPFFIKIAYLMAARWVLCIYLNHKMHLFISETSNFYVVKELLRARKVTRTLNVKFGDAAYLKSHTLTVVQLERAFPGLFSSSDINQENLIITQDIDQQLQ